MLMGSVMCVWGGCVSLLVICMCEWDDTKCSGCKYPCKVYFKRRVICLLGISYLLPHIAWCGISRIIQVLLFYLIIFIYYCFIFTCFHDCLISNIPVSRLHSPWTQHIYIIFCIAWSGKLESNPETSLIVSTTCPEPSWGTCPSGTCPTHYVAQGHLTHSSTYPKCAWLVRVAMPQWYDWVKNKYMAE